MEGNLYENLPDRQTVSFYLLTHISARRPRLTAVMSRKCRASVRAHQIDIFDAHCIMQRCNQLSRLAEIGVFHIGLELRAWNVETRAERLAASRSVLCIDNFAKTEQFQYL
jgi:hypothetical protein